MGIPIHVSYADTQVPIGQGQTISAPSLHATCLELLEPRAVPGASALDLGAGQHRDLQQQRQAQAQAQADRMSILRLHNFELFHGNALEPDDLAAAAAGGLFDAIHVGAAARSVPEAFVALLKPGGRMVLPVGPPAGMQMLTVVDKATDGSGITVSPIRDVKLAPLLPPYAERPL
ncbi:hypothetical protein GPECTOR_1g61 [Gonium pectorale]|uniref:protein-L-isoaspartate(D-aspartate) O-methyltransferase n=1 Tax=Gonium pectorale TaxID=33097 RepID=A0A150H3C8_GONPE|nr:hypothetical protein GPECTOR_1g61 [Gonium pectorale]|eukprot:KXZ56677.1 hypothetical protein GPECTOR_1g61 [Gonium pectorale]